VCVIGDLKNRRERKQEGGRGGHTRAETLHMYGVAGCAVQPVQPVECGLWGGGRGKKVLLCSLLFLLALALSFAFAFLLAAERSKLVPH
jgi:hypothetical protein